MTALDAPKLGSVVAERIVADIIRRGWPLGEVVGSESELLERYGVSRSVLREAVRLVESSGAARMRRGPGGGLVVSAPTHDNVVPAMSVWLAYQGVSLREIIEARLPVAAAACRLAAERVAPDEARQLVSMCSDLLDDPKPDGRHLGAVEAAIVDVVRNPALSLLIESVGDLGIDRIRTGHVHVSPAMSRADEARHIAGYRALVNAVANGQGEQAATMLADLTAIVLERLVEVPMTGQRSEVVAGAGRKLAEHLAVAIRNDIERIGWPVGDVLGSEADLLERYKVSRSILRESLRVLEHFGAVRTKRGPNGGIIITAPDRAVAIRTAVAVLEFEQLQSAHIVEARGVLDVAAAGLAARRCTPADAARLRSVLAGERYRADAAESYPSFHDAVAAATGNRVLLLFVDLMIESSRAHTRPDHLSPGGITALSGEVHRAHQRVMEAVVARDPDLAERRMKRHIVASYEVLH